MPFYSRQAGKFIIMFNHITYHCSIHHATVLQSSCTWHNSNTASTFCWLYIPHILNDHSDTQVVSQLSPSMVVHNGCQSSKMFCCISMCNMCFHSYSIHSIHTHARIHTHTRAHHQLPGIFNSIDAKG